MASSSVPSAGSATGERLGQKYDPSLNRFSQQVTQVLHARDRMVLPYHVPIEYQPQKLARAIVGHLPAIDVRKDMRTPPRKAPMYDDMRAYFLYESADFPPKLHLYFWPYAAVRQAIFSGVGLLAGGHTVTGDFLKYFPLAFWLTYEIPDGVAQHLRDRELQIRGCGIDAYRCVSIPTRPHDTFRPDWPEIPDDSQALLINDGFCFLVESV